jgi:spore germination protein YaaH
MESTFSYTAADGAHSVWYANGASVEERMKVALAHGFGMGAWRLGAEDPDIWRQEALNR